MNETEYKCIWKQCWALRVDCWTLHCLMLSSTIHSFTTKSTCFSIQQPTNNLLFIIQILQHSKKKWPYKKRYNLIYNHLRSAEKQLLEVLYLNSFDCVCTAWTDKVDSHRIILSVQFISRINSDQKEIPEFYPQTVKTHIYTRKTSMNVSFPFYRICQSTHPHSAYLCSLDWKGGKLPTRSSKSVKQSSI